MVWINRLPFELPVHLPAQLPTQLLSELDRAASAAAGRVKRAAGFDGAPRAEVELDEAGAKIELLVPGFGPEHVSVTVERDVVMIRGERRSELPARTIDVEGESSETAEKAEIEEAPIEASFERSLRLPFEVDADAVEAHLKYGVLNLVLPKASRRDRRVIEVR